MGIADNGGIAQEWLALMKANGDIRHSTGGIFRFPLTYPLKEFDSARILLVMCRIFPAPKWVNGLHKQ